MGEYRKSDGSTTVKGANGQISTNISGSAVRPPNPPVTITVRTPWGSQERHFASTDEALDGFDEAILAGDIVVGWDERLDIPESARVAPVNSGVLADYPGSVLAWQERNGAEDSDFSALVEREPGVFGWVTYASTAYGSGGYVPTLDATEDVLERYEVAQARRCVEVERRRALRAVSVEPPAGTFVRVVGGRKFKGREGVVVRTSRDKFKSSRYGDSFRALVVEESGDSFWVNVEYLLVEFEGELVHAVGYRSRASRAEEMDAVLSLPDPALVRRGIEAQRG